MDTQKEFEIRLFDDQGQQLLVVPVIAVSTAAAERKAEGLRTSHDGARYEVRGLMRSARYDGARGVRTNSP